MKTEIFKSKSDFYKREDKSVNGVSESFAERNSNYVSDNESNKGCWNCSDCSDCSGCSYCSCCSDCSDCSDCSYCSDKKEITSIFDDIAVDNLNVSVLDAVNCDGALEMGSWHTCETVHCWAGWIVNLAGENGSKLEKETSTQFAAMQIFKASNGYRVSPTNFFLSNDEAMVKIKEFAEKPVIKV